MEPITRNEMLLDGQDLTPITRKEMFLKRLYDKTQEVPEPITREEWFLNKAAEGGGGDVTIKFLNVTENGTYREEGVAYSPVKVNVPTPSNAYLLNDIPSGDISTFNASALPMPSLKVSVEAKQDLHGYDKPWVGGAGKNKWAAGETFSKDDSATYTPKVFTLDAGTYTISGLFTTTSPDNKVRFSFRTTNPVNVSLIANSRTRTSVTFTLDEACTTIRVYGQDNTTDTYSATYTDVMVESGETATAYTPYSNICPISGWDEANVNVTGVNIWDEEWEIGNIDNGTGLPVSSSSIIRAKNYINVKPDTTYFCKYLASEGNTTVFYYDINKNFISLVYAKNMEITTPNNCKYIRFKIASSYGTTYNHDISINYPSTDHDYHAFNGNLYTISLGQTVYGGELDVVNGGESNTHDIVDLGTLSWSYSSGQGRFSTTSLADVIKPSSGRSVDGLLCSCFECAISGTDSYLFMSGTTIYVYDSAYTDASAFTAAVTGQTLSYELATPTTLTTQPTPIKSLNGINNLSVDCGEVIEGTAFIKA